MFLICPIIDRMCGFCGSKDDEVYCGIAKNENRVRFMTKCPKKKR